MTEHAVTILVVEDSPTQALRLQITLEQQGWTTLWSASAEEALERLNDELPDLVLVDLHLPGISGDEFTRRVRMNMRTRSLPMLMLTDSDSVESQRRGFESGADDYVPKSSASDVLLLRISNLLRSTAGSLPASSPAADFRRSRTLVAVDVLAVGESQPSRTGSPFTSSRTVMTSRSWLPRPVLSPSWKQRPMTAWSSSCPTTSRRA
jgi:DNA-binding response OmpR family regulator